ncbi:signal recognition particle receptor subunit beta [Planococcus citri]|uniref:signal recognition particle receptor subunit beta n=1 Tax=Planococcus citri TaxID=170843 RepID=UPI0031F7A53C
MDPIHQNIIYVLAGVLLFVIIKLIIYLVKKHRRYQEVLFMGSSNSGKTVLFSNLIYNRIVSTYTSMVENKGSYKSAKHEIKITDIPGNERVRGRIFDEHKGFAQGILFMIDSEGIQTELREVAELLFSVLTDPVVRSNCKEVLIVCNKQDLPLAKGTTVIQMLLEKELNMLRSLKGKQLDTTSNESGKKKRPYLGSRKKDFEFSHLKPLSVSFAEAISYGTSENIQLDEVKQWLQKF